jgi:ubiquinone/menaquinone biosynthesis C-methylase UbiE
MGGKSIGRRAPPNTSWEAVAEWYNGWVGEEGSKHHRLLAIPAVLELLEPKKGEKILDIGSGQGVLASYIAKTGANYSGVEASPTLLQFARKNHVKHGRFLEGDARYLENIKELQEGEFDAAVFLLSIQDMDDLEKVLGSASWAIKAGGRVVIVMTHPCFRIPRQSGWGWDDNRKLRYRRVDRYLTPLPVPMKAYSEGVTYSFHRPLEDYINGLAKGGFLVEKMKEIATYKVDNSSNEAKAVNQANKEIPLFLGLRARKP